MQNINKYKGVSQRKNGKFEAYVMVKSATGKSKAIFKAHVGTYTTAEEARLNRKQFINSLK